MTTKTITLPWPPKELNPNRLRRLHWASRSKHMAAYKEACYWLTKKASLNCPEKPLLKVAFYPPTRARRDVDNCLASIKSGIDGIAAALGIDDSLLKNYHIALMNEAVKGGKVVVTLGEV